MRDMKWVLFNPGPVNVTETVRGALAGGDLCHREDEWFDIQDDIRRRIVSVLGLDPAIWTAVLFGGGGTAAVEAMVAGAPLPRKGIFAIDNGIYGERIAQIAAAHGMPLRRFRAGWLERPDPERLDRAVAEAEDCDAVALVHHETTTGLLNDPEAVGRIARRHGKLFIVDAVSSLGGEPLDLERAGIDMVACTANKCFQGLPGMSFVLARRAALERRAGAPPRSVYLDLFSAYRKQERRDTPFTPPVQVGMALRQALFELERETVAGRIARYRRYAAEFRAGFERLGLVLPLAPALRSGTITLLELPAGTTYEALHDGLKRAGFVIYAGQGDLRATSFRIANMGEIPDGAIARCLEALGRLIAAPARRS
jgi:2-aminoethylphosphonate-pyruvate transaminase